MSTNPPAAVQRKFDVPAYVIMLVTAALTLLGILILFSVTKDQREPFAMLFKQCLWLGVAVAAGVAAWKTPLEFLRRQTLWVVVGCVFLLLAVLIPHVGVKVNGAQRWLGAGHFRMQPSDFVKIGLVLVMADYLALNVRRMGELVRGVVFPCIILGLPVVLVFAQPDYGTAILIAAVGGCLWVLAGGRFRYILPLAGMGAAAVGVKLLHNPERLDRITSFLDIEGNKGEGAYQLYQGVLALGNGGVAGTGLGSGVQKFYLPEAHTDFVFTQVGEELGLVTTLFVVAGFFSLLVFGFLNLRKAPNLYELLLAGGCLLFILLQACINLCVVTALAPTKGMSLPFVSYGGSNLVVMYMLVGIILNCFSRWHRAPAMPLKPREL